MSVLDSLIYLFILLLEDLDGLLGLVIIVDLLLLLFLGLLRLLLFLLTALLLNWLLEGKVDGDLIELLEVARDWDLDDRWIILQIEKKLIEVHVHRGGTRIEEHQIFFNFADAANGRLEHLLDIDSLLWMHHLIVALLELAVDVDVFNIETSQMLEDLIGCPGLNILYTGIVLLTW